VCGVPLETLSGDTAMDQVERKQTTILNQVVVIGQLIFDAEPFDVDDKIEFRQTSVLERPQG
jgi:hypothetical protein